MLARLFVLRATSMPSRRKDASCHVHALPYEVERVSTPADPAAVSALEREFSFFGKHDALIWSMALLFHIRLLLP